MGIYAHLCGFELHTIGLSLLFSDNIQTPSSEFEKTDAIHLYFGNETIPERMTNAQWEVLKPP